MKTTTTRPMCPECKAYDEDTSKQIHALFSDDEIRVMCMMMGQTMQMAANAVAKLKMDDMRRLIMQRDIGMLGCSFGKFIVSLDDVRKAALRKQFKRLGIDLEISHEVCPHEAKG